MKFLRNIPIGRKLTLIAMLTSCVALLLACAAFVTHEGLHFRKTMVEALLSTAEMIGDNSSAALSFSDPASAEQTLKSLNAHPHIVRGVVYDKQGKPFATYSRGAARAQFIPPPLQADGHQFGDNSLELFRRIELAGERVGTVYIQSDLNAMHARLWRYGVIVVCVMLGASLAAFLISRRLQKVISDPISHVADVARAVAKEKNYSVRAVKHSEDELGQLIDGFNEMLDQIQHRDQALLDAHNNLEQRVQERTLELQMEIQERKEAESRLESTHKQLVDASRQAGMAEVATGVLHNVGNVLNSVNVSTTLIADNLKKSKVVTLAKAVSLIRANSSDLAGFLSSDPKGRQLPEFLAQLAEHLAAENAAFLKEMEQLRTHIEHIKEIVAMQQSYAKVSGVCETLKITDLVEDALRLNAGALVRHQVQLVRQYEVAPTISVDKHKLLQILINLIRNAKYACDDSGRQDKQITVRVSNGDEFVRVAVVDNGIGIPPENLTRIFNHGFTTRKNGHGFGLHSGALAAREMGGSLSVHSEGSGRGATFTLELPYGPNLKNEKQAA